MRTLLLLVPVLCLAKTPLTHEVMWKMKRVGAPQPSPDGRWVAVSVTDPAYDSKEQSSDLWLVTVDGSAKPRRITFTKGSESGVTWSPDSKRIAFAAKRDGDEDAQIYLLDIASGGEAQPVTSRKGGAAKPQFSPDGQWILFTGTHDPIAAERKDRKYKVRVYDTFPIRSWDKWLDEKQDRVFVQKVEAGATAKDLLEGTRLAASAGFAGVGASTGYEIEAVWAPDSKSVVFAATTNRNEAAYASTTTHLFQSPVEGGEPRQLTSGGDGYSSPEFRPDGKALYALHEREGSYAYSLSRLAKMAWPEGGQPQVISESFDRSVAAFAFTPDSKTVYFTAEDSGHERVFAMPADGGAAKPAVEIEQGLYRGIEIPAQSDKTILISNWESSVSPLEVVRIDPAARKHSFLTRFNADKAAEIDWAPPKHFWFTAKNGRKIHNLLFLPPGFDENKKYPLIAFIHGGAHLMSQDTFHTRWNYHLLTAPGYVVLTTNYSGSTGFGEAFSRAIEQDPLRGPGEEINQAVDEAIRQFRFVDGSRLAAGGASYGGHLANWLQATTTRYKCLFSHAGLINLESQWGTSDTIYHRERNNGGPVWEQGKVWREQNPIRYAAKFQTPMFLSIGENDFRVPLNQTIENWSVLQRRKVPSRLLVFPDENHWILSGENNRYFFQELHAWLKRWL